MKTETKQKECTFCSGIGYFQLLLGGSETCRHCEGNGKENVEEA